MALGNPSEWIIPPTKEVLIHRLKNTDLWGEGSLYLHVYYATFMSVFQQNYET